MNLTVHFVGIGGIGMSGIAQVLINQGYRVTGSDQVESETTKKLAKSGAVIYVGHSASNVQNANVVVISSAVKTNNPELVEAKRLRIPVIPRAEMLGEIMRNKIGIAMAGTHGKTTTTSMVASLLTHAKLDPTVIIGGLVNALGGNAKLGTGQYVVAEADESDGSFLHLPATYGVITNIDNDHMDHFGSIEALDQAFVDFVSNLPFYGLAAVCIDDPGVQRIVSKLQKPFITYGFSESAEVRGVEVVAQGTGSKFYIEENGQRLSEAFYLGVPGLHNVLNALGAFCIARRLGLSHATISEGFQQFSGVKRRFDIKWKSQDERIQIIDDYGHHPTEVAATLAAARRFWKEKIIVVFQPHRYSRTLHCRDGFLSCFKDANEVILTEVYSAGEDPIEGVNSASLLQSIQERNGSGHEQSLILAKDFEEVKNRLLATEAIQDLLNGKKSSAASCLIICMGAGSITRFADDFSQVIQKSLKQ